MDLSHRMAGIISEKDINSTITACNDVFLKYAGVANEDKILGYTDHDFPWHDYAKLYRIHELDALSGNHYSTIIPFKDYTDNELIFLHTKVQKHDHAGNVIGIQCQAIEILNPDTIKLTKLLEKYSPATQKRYCIGAPLATLPKLSPIEQEILFYLVRNKPLNAIANILISSTRKIEYYINKLKQKFDCHSKNELIDLAIMKGYLEVLPISLKLATLNEALVK